MNLTVTPELIVEKTRQWLGTPYVHQASVKHHGCDCLGLVRGIWREVIGKEPRSTPNYSPDWGEIDGDELLQRAADSYFEKSEATEPRPADLILFRWHAGSIIKHLGIITAPTRFIHAYEKAGVVENTLARDWKNRIAGIYRFPGIAD